MCRWGQTTYILPVQWKAFNAGGYELQGFFLWLEPIGYFQDWKLVFFSGHLISQSDHNEIKYANSINLKHVSTEYVYYSEQKLVLLQ